MAYLISYEPKKYDCGDPKELKQVLFFVQLNQISGVVYFNKTQNSKLRGWLERIETCNMGNRTTFWDAVWGKTNMIS